MDFLNNCKQPGVYPKFLIFKLPNVSHKDALSIPRRLLCRAINKRNKELWHLSKEFSLSEIFLSTQLTTIDFYIFTKSITSYNKKLLQKSLYTQQKKSSSLTQLTKLLLISRNSNYSRKNMINLKQVYTFQSNQIKFENPKSPLPLKRFIVRFLIKLNPRKPKVRLRRISLILRILVFTTINLLHVYYINIVSYKTLERIKILLQRNPIKEMELSS